MSRDLVDSLLNLGDVPLDEYEQVALEPFKPESVDSNPTRVALDVVYDYATVRGTLHLQQQMLLEASKVALEFSRNSESPKAFEAFSKVMKQLTEVNAAIVKHHTDLMDLEDKRREMDKEKGKVLETDGAVYMNPLDLINELGSQSETKRIENEE